MLLTQSVSCFMRERVIPISSMFCPGMHTGLDNSSFSWTTFEDPEINITQSRLDFYANGTDGFEIQEDHFLDLSYDFGEKEVTVTGLGIGIGDGDIGSDQHVFVFFSADGENWSESGEYRGRDTTVRVDSGQITARHFRLLWEGGHGPIVSWLVGCAVDPEKKLRPSYHKMKTVGIILRLVVFAIALCISLYCVTSCIACCRQSWKYGKPWRWRLASSPMATTAPLLELQTHTDSKDSTFQANDDSRSRLAAHHTEVHEVLG